MGYIRGKGYLKANKRWFGVPDDSDPPVNECAAILDMAHGGRRHYWAPYYNTRVLANASDDYLVGQTVPEYEITGYSTDDNTIKFYKVANHWCYPAFVLNSYSYTGNEAQAMPGATLETFDGTSLIINSDVNPLPLSQCDQLPLIIPKISVYAITCTKNTGSSSNYRNPLPGSGFLTNKTIGRQNFLDKWNQYVALSCPVPLVLRVGGAWVNPVLWSPTGFSYRNGSTSANITRENYNQTNNGFYKPNWNNNYKVMIGEENCMAKTLTYQNSMYVESIDVGQLLNDTNSAEYNYQNATQFQCVYVRADTDAPNGERFWGYLCVIDDVKLEMTTLHS